MRPHRLRSLCAHRPTASDVEAYARRFLAWVLLAALILALTYVAQTCMLAYVEGAAR